MTTEIDPILRLADRLKELIEHAGVDHQTALDALKNTMAVLLVEEAGNIAFEAEAGRKRVLELLRPQQNIIEPE